MTQHDKISAYIDNELSHEAEQDFLISLASNDGVRKAFRSELVMKNVIHQDELATLPNRDLRGAILATVGVAGASVVTAEASAASAVTAQPAVSGLKMLFASKLNVFITAGIVTLSAAGGYVTNTIVHSKTDVPVQAPAVQTAAPAPMNSSTPITLEAPAIESEPVIEAPVKKTATPKKAPLDQQTTTHTSGTTSMPAGLKVDISTQKNPK